MMGKLLIFAAILAVNLFYSSHSQDVEGEDNFGGELLPTTYTFVTFEVISIKLFVLLFQKLAVK